MGRGRGQRLEPELYRQVMDLLAAGLGLAQVARLSGVSPTQVYLMRRKVGGVFRPAGKEYSARYLSREERYEIARLVDAGHTLREVARRIGRPASTVSRELARNRDARCGGYQPERADFLAWQRQRRPKRTKLAQDPLLRAQVQQLLDRRHSPEQVAGRLPLLFPDNPSMRISHETIYQGIYVYPRGELKRELRAHLRTRRTTRRRHGRQDRRGTIKDLVSIHERPEEIEARLVPGHHEGDLVMGSRVSNSAVGTLVERTTGYLTLLHLPNGHRAPQVADAVIEQVRAMPDWFAKTLTWDRGVEMAEHARITNQTGLRVYFADPYAPYQRGSNENTNGLLREYLPKGTDLSIQTLDDLQAIADELNDRPRKRLGFHTPREALASLLESHIAGVATTP